MFGSLGQNRTVTTVFRIVDTMSPALRSIAAGAQRARMEVSALTRPTAWSQGVADLTKRVLGDTRSQRMMRDMGGRYTSSFFDGAIGSVYRGSRDLYRSFQRADIVGTLKRAATGAFEAARTGLAVTGVGGGLMGLLGGGLALGGIAQVHSQFEDTSGAIAGMLSALGVSGDFNAGLRDAANVMDAITVAAARLPGEAEDYIAVFRAGLPHVQGALPGGSLEDIYNFTNRLTAIGSTLGVQSDLIGRDIADMLAAGRGHASIAQTQVFAAMLPFMRQVQGQAALTAESFNKMTEQKRAKLLQDTFAKLDPMLQHSANSFGAMSGALASTGRMLVRLSTAPLFNAMKRGMGEINSLIADDNGRLTAFGTRIVTLGNLISTALGGAFDFVTARLHKLPDLLDRLGNKVLASPITQQIGHLGARLYGAASRTLGSRDGRSGAAGAAGAFAAGGPMGLVVGPLMEFAQNTRAVNATARAGLSIVDRAIGLAEPVLRVMGEINSVLGGMLGFVLPGLAQGIAMIVAPLSDFAMGVVGVVSVIVAYLKPHLEGLAQDFGGLLTALGAFIASQLRLMGPVLLHTVSILSEWVVPALTGFVEILRWTIRQIASVLRFLGHTNTVAADRFLETGRPGMPSTVGRDQGANLLDRMREAWNQSSAATAQQHADAAARAAHRHPTPAARSGHQTVFNHNRFDIRQSFESGFDPDRMAVTFSEDIERSVQYPLQSGLAPAYGVR